MPWKPSLPGTLAVCALVLGTLQPALGLVSDVTANGVTAGGWAKPRVTPPGSATTLVAKVVSSTDRTVSVDLRVFTPAGGQTFRRTWDAQRLTATRQTLLKAPWKVPATAGKYRVQVTVSAPDGSLLVDNPRAFVVVADPSAGRFGTLAPGAALPTGAQCAALVRAAPVPPEIKGVNRTANATQGSTPAGVTGLQARVDGRFTGTTEQVLRWAACKWGVDEDVVKAQTAIESWWRMDTRGDLGTDPARCPPGHGLRVDGTAGRCPESWGLLQVRYPYNLPAFPDALRSSAFNADWAYASFRSCYEGELTWLNTVEHVGSYAAGDLWGCVGVWFSGRWHTADAEGYITRVKGYLTQRIWTTPDFAQP
jgi:hypothetical protein